MTVLLVIAALVAVAIGVLALTQATLGIGLIAIGCFLGILARIAQASEHRAATRREANSKPEA